MHIADALCAIAGCTLQAERHLQAAAVAQLRARLTDGVPDQCPAIGLPICYKHRGGFSGAPAARALSSISCCSCGKAGAISSSASRLSEAGTPSLQQQRK